jgi:hypothetical protein
MVFMLYHIISYWNIFLPSYHADYKLNNYDPDVSKTRTTVSLDIEVYRRLRSRGEFGQTFSEVVGKILDQLDAVNGGSKKR